jgi:hypothetical protein
MEKGCAVARTAFVFPKRKTSDHRCDHKLVTAGGPVYSSGAAAAGLGESYPVLSDVMSGSKTVPAQRNRAAGLGTREGPLNRIPVTSRRKNLDSGAISRNKTTWLF